MLQSSVLEPLLSQILDPAPKITELVPYFVSLISNDTQRALISYISKPSQKLTDGGVNEYKNGEPEAIEEFEGSSHLGYVQQQSASSKTQEIKKEIEVLNSSQFCDDYINADSNPRTMLNVLSLSVIKQWCDYLQSNNCKNFLDELQTYEHGKYRFYIHGVKDEYSVLVCCDENYPTALIVGKLENLCSILAERI